ncbi:MAG: response regulator [Planctomycetaceae bacterium]|nr:response regulator [Planctomycetaceae bacterium]
MQDGKHVILCIDDDDDILFFLRTILEAGGYKVLTAGTAEEGLRLFKSTPPDFLIIDLMMEEVDAGTRLVKELKLLGNSAPVYMLSSVGDHLNLTADYSSLGLSGVLQKPVDEQQLLAILEAKLAK